MEGFEKKVLIIAGIILVVSLVLVLIFILMSKGNQKYPPVESECPDYWELGQNPDLVEGPEPGANQKLVCNNVKGLGDSTPYVDPDSREFQGVDGLCNKQNWARQHNVTWEGVTEPTKDACIEDNVFQ